MTNFSLTRTARALRWLAFGTLAQKRRVRLELARMSASAFGDFPLSEDGKVWRTDSTFFANYKRLSGGNPYSQDRKWVLREFVLSTNGLEGDLAECGCFEGASAYFMAEASTHGEILLFDSFEGLSLPTEQDRLHSDMTIAWKSGELRSSEHVVRANLSIFDAIRILPGWIPDRFSEVSQHTFRLVHIDVDLYQPTRKSLEFFFPRLVNLGVIVLDDYGFEKCPGAMLAADDFAASVGARILHLPTGQGVLVRHVI